MKYIGTGVFGIEVELEGRCGTIKSDLREGDYNKDDIEYQKFEKAVDGIEAMILAHACAGIDITTPAYLEGIETAVEAVGNNI